MKGAFIAACVGLVASDTYLHLPRGSNNRCDEKNNNRNNANRNFDSENNDAGGYGVCDHNMYYYEGTTFRAEFYSQHSCGNGDMNKDEALNQESTVCQEVLQLGCDWTFGDPLYAFEEVDRSVNPYQISDGSSFGRPGADIPEEVLGDGENPDDVYNTFGDTCTQRRVRWYETCDGAFIDENNCQNLDLQNQRGTFNGNQCECSARKFKTYGYHESEYWYDMCKSRERNKGLWTADQNVQNNDGAQNDRQEPNSNRYGFECTEERDYWPYWHPTPWIDLAVFVSNTTKCKFYTEESQNVKDKCWCKPKTIPTPSRESREIMLEAGQYNQELTCDAADHDWVCEGAWDLPEPACLLAPAQTDNRLGNTNLKGRRDFDNDDSFSHFDWEIPKNYLDSLPNKPEMVTCVLRLRYNISTGDIYDDLDSLYNNLVVQDDPVNVVGEYPEGELLTNPDAAETEPTNAKLKNIIPVRMAINTAQFGRTFEDRSYTFDIKRRPKNLNGKTILNLNVRGKRGNIAQVRNCVEYDFVPKNLKAKKGDYVHFQWCGTDYNNNGNAGEGRQGTDRTNICELWSGDVGFANSHPQTMNLTVGIFSEEDQKHICWLGQSEEYCYTLRQMLGSKKNSGNDPKSCHFLNGVRDPEKPYLPTPYFDYIAEIQRKGTFNYMATRNNNFTNRSQKGTIAVNTAGLSTGAIVAISVSAVVVVAGVAGIAFMAMSGSLSGFSFKSSRV